MTIHEHLAAIDRLDRIGLNDVIRRAHFEEGALVQQQQPIAILTGEIQIMGHPYDRQAALLIHPMQNAADLHLMV